MITGGAGYIGSCLTHRLLEAGHKVTVLDLGVVSSPLHINNSSYRFQYGDIRDDETMKKLLKGADALIHMAFLSNDPNYRLDPSVSQEVNINAFESVAKHAYDEGVKRVIFPSSCSVYGRGEDSDRDVGLTEIDALDPLTEYAKSKIKCEEILMGMPASNDQIRVILRPATVFGASVSMRLDLLINSMVFDALANSELTIENPNRIRPVLCIEDLCRLYELILNCDPGLIDRQVFNVAYENNSLLDSATLVANYLDVPLNLSGDYNNDARTYRVSSQKVAQVLGFKPEYTVASYLPQLDKRILEITRRPDFSLDNYTNIGKQQSYFSNESAD